MMNLNPQQKAAANNIEGPMIVLAGPGTGKTQIIAARIANILETTQMDPHNILCLTFTESGVAAMRKRLIEMIGTAAYYVRIHTFHSFCNDVIKEFPEKFLFASELESLTDVERVQVFRAIIQKLSADSPLKPFGAPYLYQRDLMHSISNLKRENISPDDLKAVLKQAEDFLKKHGTAVEDVIAIHGNQLKSADLEAIRQQLTGTPLQHVLSDAGDFAALEKKARTQLKNDLKKAYLQMRDQLPKQQELAAVFTAYQAALKKRGRYDYEDMILFVVRKFREDEQLLARYQEQFQYILVDEYQDTNNAQNLVVQLIGEFFDNPNIFVVGDDKQSIYRFQGASLENILYFYQLYKKDIEVVSLTSNYRSQQTILDAAHSLIQHNEQGMDTHIPEANQQLASERDIPAAPVKLAEFASPGNEQYFLAKKVQDLIADGTSPSEIAIFYRNNRDADALVDLFLRLGVPFRLEAGKNILNDNEISKLIRLLKFLAALGPSGQASGQSAGNALFYVLHFDFLDFDSLDILKLTRAASKARKDLFEMLLAEDKLAEADLANPSAFTDFAKLCLSWQTLAINRPFSEFFDHVIKESGYLDAILEQPEKVEHLNRLNTLFDFIKKENRANHELTLEDFIAHIELLSENDIIIKEQELKTSENAVRLMTAHKAKGLEFEQVFITGCTDKHWGNKPSMDKIKMPVGLLETAATHKEKNEDERRLFYVAMTRAKRGLHLTYSRTNDNGRDQVPSIFVEEIPDEFIQRIDTAPIEEEANERLQTVFLSIPQETRSAQEMDFVRGLLDGYRMSVTHLNNYLRCPRLFYYQNLLRVPSSMNKHAAFGSAVHGALQDFATEHKKLAAAPPAGATQPPPKDFFMDRFDHHMRRQVVTKEDLKHNLEFGQKVLSDYYDHHYDNFSQYVLPEYNFSSHGVNLDGIQLTGKLDLIRFLEPDKPGPGSPVHVIDYKTGNPSNKRSELKTNGEYWRQIVFYQLLCNLSPKFEQHMVSGEINFVQPGKGNEFVSSRFEVSQADLEMLTATIKDTYEDIMNLAFMDPGDMACGECDYCRMFA